MTQRVLAIDYVFRPQLNLNLNCDGLKAAQVTYLLSIVAKMGVLDNALGFVYLCAHFGQD